MKNRGGRPRNTPVPDKGKIQLGGRISVRLRKRLEYAIAESGKSISQEVESRLERTFRDDELLTELREIRAMLDGGGR